MLPYYQDNTRTVYNKSCTSMDELPDESVQMVVTSPPYWGLRKYAGNQDLIWGGENHHEHSWGNQIIKSLTEQTCYVTGRASGEPYAPGKKLATGDTQISQGNYCQFCNAWRGSYGLEPTPELYVAHSIEILREIRRVLRKDGVVFWNLGDSYFGGGNNRGNGKPLFDKQASNRGAIGQVQTDWQKHEILKPKDLCLIPFRVAIAAQEDGWWVRSVIIWSKNNPMPESVKDRPTESHEYILLLTKSSSYYWDQEAVREPHSRDWSNETASGYLKPGNMVTIEAGIPTAHIRSEIPPQMNPAGRNLRSIWEFPTQGYPEAHFATFPEELPERCIKAGTPEYGCCDKCGRPYERIIERTGHVNKREPAHCPNNCETKTDSTGWAPLTVATNEWKQACTCQDSKPAPSVVLDPFAGSGTTLFVATRLNRKSVGYEISEEYCKLIVERNKQMALGV